LNGNLFAYDQLINFNFSIINEVVESVKSKSDTILEGQTGLMEGQRRHNEDLEGVVSNCNKIKSGNLVNFKLNCIEWQFICI